MKQSETQLMIESESQSRNH